MFDRFNAWQYRDDANCWDFVREFLLEYTDIPIWDLPSYEIHPDDKRSMHRASIHVAKNFVECKPVDGAIACHFYGNVLYHVGIVWGGRVRHTGKKHGTRHDTIKAFEKLSQTTKYRIHKSFA